MHSREGNPHRQDNGAYGRAASERRRARARLEWLPPPALKLVETPSGHVWVRADASSSEPTAA